MVDERGASDSVEAHQLHAADFATPHELLRDSRGWTHNEWNAAPAQLRTRRLVVGGELTGIGRALRNETETDRLAGEPIDRALSDRQAHRLTDIVTPLSRQVADCGVNLVPNPMGLTKNAPGAGR